MSSKFVQLYEITFPEAVARLAERARIPIETEENPAARQTRGARADALLKLHRSSPNGGSNVSRTRRRVRSPGITWPGGSVPGRRPGIPASGRRRRRDDTVNWAQRGASMRTCANRRG